MLKDWMARKLKLSRLFAASTLLLLKQINDSAPEEGVEGNDALKRKFLDLFHVLKPNVFLDIGANDGSAALMIRQEDPDCVIHSFEANPGIQSRSEPALRAANIRSWNQAVTDKEARVEIHVPKTLSRAYIGGQVIPASIIESEDTGKSSLLRRNEDATYDHISVSGVSLDGFVEREISDWDKKSFFLWIDVEGAADKVIDGAARMLSRTQVIFVETEGFDFWIGQKGCVELTKRLMRLGFLPLARDREYGDKQFNMIFIHHNIIDQVTHMIISSTNLPRKNESIPTNTQSAASIKPYLSLSASLYADTPVIIPTFNNYTYVKMMVEQLQRLGIRHIHLLDNGSTHPKTVEYLINAPIGVSTILTGQNNGPRYIFRDRSSFASLPRIFCLTDPDLMFSKGMPDDFIYLLASLTEKHKVGKAGLALDISDPDLMVSRKFKIGQKEYYPWEWESQFWKTQIDMTTSEDPIYLAPVDTTFAIYNKDFIDLEQIHSAVRVAGRYTCKHLPWYKDNLLPAEEESWYRDNARNSYYLGIRDPKAP